ncbi:MAG: hypothetical protein ACREU2_01925, partial [Steroidobacteraceae bacterium]
MALIAAALSVVVEAPVCVSIWERSALSRSAVTTTVGKAVPEVPALPASLAEALSVAVLDELEVALL